ncbi:glycosyltransferase [Microbulbifer variabilis]|uniref:Glycosyltransferase n=2 Tax=Microbulbifer TaxID=48073 RepID=A0ABY4VGV5_9GAMM|nr:glycosyltransferase [Microbulbifer variabilis]USD22388.1 glycosyltransferase [Microbulbifer variabilis]
MKKKILLVSWHFPPYKSSSAFNLFKRLKDTCFEFDVIQAYRDEKPDNERMFNYSLSCFNRYEVTVPSEDARNTESRMYFVERVIDYYRILRDHNHYSVLLSHSHENISHMAAMAIKKLNPQLRWIASFGDPIAANPYNHSYKFPMLKEDIQLEEEVLQKADRIIVTNPYQQKIVLSSQTKSIQKSKFFVLPHCFDDRMYEKELQKKNKAGEKTSIFRFMHIGMLYKFKRTSEPFMLGAQRLLQKHPNLKGRIKIDFYGANDSFIKAAEKYDLKEVVSFKGTVDYLKSLTLMTKADCLLLRDAEFSEQGLDYSPFFPGKLADYLGAKRPVLAVTMKNGYVPDILSKLGGASLSEDNIEGIADAMYGMIKGRYIIDKNEAESYSCKHNAEKARETLTFKDDKKVILITGHDLKFAKFVINEVKKNTNFIVLVDKWESHEKHDEEKSLDLLNQADVIFCEWGLGNLVWYSKNKKKGQKLITRVHAQELKTEHLKRCNHENIDFYIFVSPYYYELMVEKYSLARNKCRMIFNMIDREFLDKPKLSGSEFNLGMIGDVPQSKRLDRALDIFEDLYQNDNRYKLFIKGKRPEEYPWMHSKAKKNELFFYKQLYKRIETNNWMNNVIFEGFGPIDEWLRKIGWILSVSDNESFHLSVAEGMASGSTPILLNWPGSEYIYNSNYIFNTISTACNYIKKNKSHDSNLQKNYTRKFCHKLNSDRLISLF